VHTTYKNKTRASGLEGGGGGLVAANKPGARVGSTCTRLRGPRRGNNMQGLLEMKMDGSMYGGCGLGACTRQHARAGCRGACRVPFSHLCCPSATPQEETILRAAQEDDLHIQGGLTATHWQAVFLCSAQRPHPHSHPLQDSDYPLTPLLSPRTLHARRAARTASRRQSWPRCTPGRACPKACAPSSA
jgi:hypothetical protein